MLISYKCREVLIMEENNVYKDIIEKESKTIRYEKRIFADDLIAIVRHTHQKEPEVLRKRDLKWTSVFEPENDLYLRAYSFGQGCWEELFKITEEEAKDILNEWGYKEDK